MAFVNAGSTSSAVSKQAQIRRENLSRIMNDPYMGYSSIAEATDDCKGSSQVEVMCRLLNRENLFISGPAGSGKTTVIKRFVDMIDAVYGGVFNIAVTATTGLAATNIGGKTIHSWSGLGVMEEPIDIRAMYKSRQKFFALKAAIRRIRYCDVLVIDEISMLHAYYLDNLDKIMKHARKNDEPFGGVQVVLLGDFMQLPPVPSQNPVEGLNYGFAIQADSWKQARINHCYLDKVHRAEDENLKHLLLCIERSKMDSKARAVIEKCKSNSKDKSKQYTTLFTTNINVDRYNQKKLDENPNISQKFFLRKVSGSEKDLEKLIKSNNLPPLVELKTGATVIVTRNITDPDGEILAANGSVGRVELLSPYNATVRLNDGSLVTIEYQSATETKKVTEKAEDGSAVTIEKQVAQVLYLPLKLGYAITVHKSQGQTLDGIEVDLSRCFTPGLGYVALSRVRSADNMVISKISDDAFDVDPLSRKISTYVKKKSLVSRKEFTDRVDEYSPLLNDTLALSERWDVSTSGVIRQQMDEA